MKNVYNPSKFAGKRNRSIIIFTTSACLTLVFSSCLTTRFYTPNRNPVPFFKNKGDVYFDFSTNFLNKADATIGYAFINGLAAYAGAGFSSQSSSTVILRPEIPFKCTSENQNYGIGYFLNEKKSKRFRFEIFFDLGLGKYQIIKYPGRDDYYNLVGKTAYLSGQFKKIGALVNIGRTTENRIFQYGYTARFSNLEFYNPSFIEKERLTEEIDRLNSKPDYYLFEHGLFGKIGRKSVKFQGQFVFYHGQNTNSEDNAIGNFNFALIVGININPNIFAKR